jgi:hypothetical protein
MSDSRATDPRQENSWLEAQLSRQLCPVSAPDALWNRIHEQRRPLRVRPERRLIAAWSVAFALLIVAAGMFWRMGVTRDPSGDISSISSNDAQQIRAWIRAKSNIDIPLPDSAAFDNQPVRLLGARVIRMRQYSVAVVNYRVGGESAAMMVTDRPRADPGGIRNIGHTSPQMKISGNSGLYSWSRGPDNYTIAFSGAKQSQAACMLCHVNTPALMVFR